MKRAPQVADSGRIVDVPVVLLAVASAAARIGCSASYLNQVRAADARRLARGEQIEGPKWCRLPFGIRYRVADLDEWIASKAVPFGVCQESRRAPSSEVAQ